MRMFSTFHSKKWVTLLRLIPPNKIIAYSTNLRPTLNKYAAQNSFYTFLFRRFLHSHTANVSLTLNEAESFKTK